MKTTMTLLFTAALLSLACAATASDATAPDNQTVLIKIGDALEDYWVVVKKVAPKYPRPALKRKQQGCATVGYFVEADGSTSEHWVIASHPEKIFDRSAIRANKKFSYTPGDLNSDRKPVMTINTFTYNLTVGGVKPDKEANDAFSKLCREAAVNALKSQFGAVL